MNALKRKVTDGRYVSLLNELLILILVASNSSCETDKATLLTTN